MPGRNITSSTPREDIRRVDSLIVYNGYLVASLESFKTPDSLDLEALLEYIYNNSLNEEGIKNLIKIIANSRIVPKKPDWLDRLRSLEGN